MPNQPLDMSTPLAVVRTRLALERDRKRSYVVNPKGRRPGPIDGTGSVPMTPASNS